MNDIFEYSEDGRTLLSIKDNLVKEVVIPNSVTYIGNYAFNGCCSLKCISIPDSVTSIGEYAFCHCTVLESINIPNSITYIGNNAFSGCSALKNINIHSESIENITFYDSFRDINFYNCTLHIPIGKRQEYLCHFIFRKFKNIIEGFD